ncbi:MAG: hypothetical protein Tsb006_3520 [Rickettsiaceae bacterium]
MYPEIISPLDSKTRIIIVGCGLSGMITALAFASYNIPTTIIERRKVENEAFFHDIRTTALTASSKNFFREIGIWEPIADIAGQIKDIYVVDNKAPEMLHFASDELEDKEIMGHLVENKHLKKSYFRLPWQTS